MAVAASEYYNTAFEVALSSLLGVMFTPRPDTTGSKEPVREITGVPYGMIEHWSRRRTQIEARYDELARAYRADHGRDPGPAACHKLARQANLDTRQGKKPLRSLEDRRTQWRQELTEVFGPAALTRLTSAVPARTDLPVSPAPDITHLAERTVAHVSANRSTWTRWNLRAEAERLLRAECHLATPAEHRQSAEAVVAMAISPALSLCTDAPALLNEPPSLRRADGESVFTQHGAARYTSQAVLDAEQRLLNATRTPTVTGTSALSAQAALDGYEARSGATLDPGQRHLVTTFASDDRLLLAGIGPAGAGKTTAMRALAHVLGQHRRRLIPLATSAASAAVLARELGVPAENLHKFLHEWDRGHCATRLRAGSPVPYAARLYALAPGDVVLVDEAGMAGTFRLDRLVSVAASRGAVVRLLGDDRQLSAVESGGALRLIAAQPGTPQLTRLYRFRDPAEAAATLQLRTGDTTAIAWYTENGRIRSGSREGMTQAAYDGWKADMLAGKTTLMAAGDGADVTALSAQARAERVTAAQVENRGVTLRDGTLAGAGDWIVTRDNNRRLPVRGGRDWVRNGDGWQVTARHHDGSLTCKHLEHGGRVRLPSDYVRAHVQLLYATTAHRAEGTTVDTAHPLITPGMTREILYVLASRARQHTILYVTTHDLPPLDEDEHTDRVKHDPRSYAAREILHNILAAEGTELSATETIRTSQEQAGSLATLIPRYLHAAHQLAETRYRDAAIQVFGDQPGQALIADPAWGALARHLYDAETAGWPPATLLTAVARQREFDSAESVAEVLCWRIDGYLPDRTPPPRMDQPAEADTRRYATLLSKLPGISPVAFDPAAALTAPASITGPGHADAPPEHDAETPAAERYAGILTTVLGSRLAQQAQAEPAWPALQAALRRTVRTGHDPVATLTAAARTRELRTARSITEVLAWRIGTQLTALPGQSEPVRRTRNGEPGTEAWRQLAWTLKAAENQGTPAEQVVRQRPLARSLRDLIQAAQNVLMHHDAVAMTGPLPWVTSPHQRYPAQHTDLVRYLSDAAELIAARIAALTHDARSHQPAWMTLLGHPPQTTAAREQWLHHIGIIAAYRDQYQVATDDPRQVLGPYAEPCHAGHAAYWHAAGSVVTARHLAGLDPATSTHTRTGHVADQIAADIYLSLPESDRAAIQSAISQQLGPLWFGHPTQADDHAVTRPIHAPALSAALAERGSITLPVKHPPQLASLPQLHPLEEALINRRASQPATNPRPRTQNAHPDNQSRSQPFHEARQHRQQVADRHPYRISARSRCRQARLGRNQPVLCPRCRAGLSDANRGESVRLITSRFYALDVGRGLATDALREASLSCGFGVRFSILPRDRGPQQGKARLFQTRTTLTSMFTLRQPRSTSP